MIFNALFQVQFVVAIDLMVHQPDSPGASLLFILLSALVMKMEIFLEVMVSNLTTIKPIVGQGGFDTIEILVGLDWGLLKLEPDPPHCHPS